MGTLGASGWEWRIRCERVERGGDRRGRRRSASRCKAPRLAVSSPAVVERGSRGVVPSVSQHELGIPRPSYTSSSSRLALLLPLLKHHDLDDPDEEVDRVQDERNALANRVARHHSRLDHLGVLQDLF